MKEVPLQESSQKKAVWLKLIEQKLPVGTRVRIKESDVPQYVGQTGTVTGYDVGTFGDWPLVRVVFDKDGQDGFYDDEVEPLEKVA